MAKTRKILRLPPRWLKIAEGNHRALILCETRALAHLREAATRATQAVALRVGSLGSPDQARRVALQLTLHASVQLVSDVSRGVLTGRREARAAALDRLAVELSQAAKELRFPPPVRAPMGDSPEDAVLVQVAAESYASAWKASVTLATMKWDAEESLSRVILASSTQIDYRLTRIAATEVSRAYSDAHDEGAGWTADYYKDARWLGLLVKRWDAMLDAKACQRCKDMDGRFALLGMSYRGGAKPGDFHANCRCMDSIIPLPVHMRGELQPGELVDDEHPRDRAA